MNKIKQNKNTNSIKNVQILNIYILLSTLVVFNLTASVKKKENINRQGKNKKTKPAISF
jgi:hypothetical protein